MTPTDALNYIDKNYDITVGVGAELFGIGSVGHGYFTNRKSSVYNLQHYYSLKDSNAYERVIGETGGNKPWTKLVSNSDFEATKTELVLEKAHVKSVQFSYWPNDDTIGFVFENKNNYRYALRCGTDGRWFVSKIAL